MTGRDDTRLLIGAIGGAHGVRGEVWLKSFAAEPEDIASYGALESEDGDRRFEIKGLRRAGGKLVARIRGVGDRDRAAALKGTALYVARARLPEPEPGTWYHADLIGLEAVGEDGAEFGTVIAVQDFGAGDLLEIRLAGTRETVLVPFTEACAPRIDIVGRKIVVAPPEGLIEPPD